MTESGSIFVQIGDENVHLVRCLLDEVFGSGNFISQITVKKTTSGTGNYLGGVADYIIWHAKNIELTKFKPIYAEKEIGGEGTTGYTKVELPDGKRRSMTSEELRDPSVLPKGSKIFSSDNITSQSMGREKGEGAASWFTISLEGKEFTPGMKARWKTNQAGMVRLINADRVAAGSGSFPGYRRYFNDFPATTISNVWTDTVGQNQFGGDKFYVVQTALKVIERCLLMTTDPGDLVLDPTCGSGTTAYVAEQWGRRWITCDTSRVALALARTRLMAARYPYYYLADSEDGSRKQAEVTGKLPLSEVKPTGDLRKGFVYKTVPHVTLKAIANNSEIDDIHARWQEKLEPLRAELNALLKQSWQEWEIPREASEQWPAKAGELLAQWWDCRRQRQREIDDSIARNADTETLYDQPYEDKKRVRVTGPFTVESLSPHRVLSTDEERPVSETTAKREAASGQFETMILDNLRKAGVQNTIKNERLKFDALEPFAGAWIHGAGAYTDSTGAIKRVAVSIGPEHGTVGPEQVKEAAKEAVQGIGFDLLIVCGFAFDPHVSEEAKRYGKLTVLSTRMNPDLAMSEELLKKTGSGNLFMIFGEPDIQPVDSKTGQIKPGADGKIQIEIKGLDIYDPTTGQIRSNSTADIACWFIDTNYNGESFFVRHAYFTGGDKPYEKLQRALKAEVDEAAWAELYATKSRPFDCPETGKIAVKVINHYGDEVLKVFGVEMR